MLRECAFCQGTAKLSGEHLWSNWMNTLFAGRKRFRVRDRDGKVTVRHANQLDWTGNVVCEKCNGTWMSDIENKHAKPAMRDLILGEGGIKVTQSRADSIARFAFKTAVVLDHMQRRRAPFFSRSTRHGFRESHAVPATVGMWLAGLRPSGTGYIHTVYHEGPLASGSQISLYVCTYAVGHLVFQVVAQNLRIFDRSTFCPSETTYAKVAIPFWPWIPAGVVWPPPRTLETVGDFESFAERWRRLLVR